MMNPELSRYPEEDLTTKKLLAQRVSDLMMQHSEAFSVTSADKTPNGTLTIAVRARIALERGVYLLNVEVIQSPDQLTQKIYFVKEGRPGRYYGLQIESGPEIQEDIEQRRKRVEEIKKDQKRPTGAEAEELEELEKLEIDDSDPNYIRIYLDSIEPTSMSAADVFGLLQSPLELKPPKLHSGKTLKAILDGLKKRNDQIGKSLL